MPKQRQITLMDTTLRDGEQTQGVSFAPEEKVSMATALLGKLKVDRIEVASARVSKGEQEAVAQINAWAEKSGYANRVEVLGFTDGTKSVDWIVEANGKVINLLTKGSEKHCLEQLRITHEEHIKRIKETVEYAKSQGLAVNVYLEDWSNGYIDSPEYVFAHTEALSHMGIDHFMLPDTLGVMSPKEVFKSLKDMIARFPDLHFDFHPHNDYGLATANAMAAVEAGINSIHCTINCLGERAGNVSLAQITVVLRDKMNMKINIKERHIVDVSQMVASFSGKFVASNAPVLGADVFTQTAGIHADGDQKGGLYETKLNPERFARKREYALGKMSGKASLAKNLEALGITLSVENQKKVLARVVELGDSKQKITTDDLPFIIADVIIGSDYQHIKLTGCSITGRLDEKTHVAIDVEVHGESHTATGSGNGGFDAFRVALDKILMKYEMQLPSLLDYEIRIPRGGQTSALTEAVISWQLENGSKTSTRGVHANQVYAAMNAALRMTNMLLQAEKQKIKFDPNGSINTTETIVSDNTKKIAILAGDGIGPEIMAEGIKVLKVIEARNDINFELVEAPFGATAWFSHGSSFPDETKKLVDEADAVIKGPIGLGHEESKQIPIDEQPERGALLPMRARMNTYANYRPVFLPKSLAHFSPLKPEIIGDGIDMIMVRELVGGVYFGKKFMGVNEQGKRYVTEALEYDEDQIKNILVKAFELAQTRKKVLHNIHKSNVLKSSVLWNEILEEVKVDYADVEVIHMLVDAAATHLCLNPTQFDVMVMENMFGDILSDQGGGILGSLGLMPSACIGPTSAYYEPSHGSAPDIAGKAMANPYSMIGSFAMMLEYSFDMKEESKNIWDAMQAVFADGFSTSDLSKPGSGVTMLSTHEFGDKVVEHLQNNA